MRLLLDTHVIYWWLADRRRISRAGLAAVGDVNSEVYVSIASAWEMAIKVGAGKWPEAARLLEDFEGNAATEEFRTLPISVPHVRAAGLMQLPHRDPFDRLLAAQAQIEGLTLVTADAKLHGLGASWLW